MLESAIQSWRGRLSEEAFDVLERIVGYVDAHYVTHVVFNGVNELKFRRSGKTLLTLYIEEQSITALVIFGKQERLNYEAVQASFSEFIQNYYRESNTYHDGKWMFIRLHDPEYVHDVLRLVQIKKKPDQRVISMCGYRCDLCKAHSRNIRKSDQREGLAWMWRLYYGLDEEPGSMYCDVCRARRKGAIRIDAGCPVRDCVLQRSLNSCGDCPDYPCPVFAEREGLCFQQARDKGGDYFYEDDFGLFLRAFDNRTRLDRLRKVNLHPTP
jgi:formylmethanofuran dehydrogenase subunit E